MYVQRRYGIPTPSGAPVRRLCGELALDESERSLPVHGAIALVHVGVVARAAVGVWAVAVALDFAGRLGG